MPCHGRFTPRKEICTHCTGGWVGIRGVWMGVENVAPTRLDPWTVQPVATRYIDYTILAHSEIL